MSSFHWGRFHFHFYFQRSPLHICVFVKDRCPVFTGEDFTFKCLHCTYVSLLRTDVQCSLGKMSLSFFSFQRSPLHICVFVKDRCPVFTGEDFTFIFTFKCLHCTYVSLLRTDVQCSLGKISLSFLLSKVSIAHMCFC